MRPRAAFKQSRKRRRAEATMMKFFKSLSARLLFLTLMWVSFIVCSVGYTMYLNWQLEASAAGRFTAAEIRYNLFRLSLFTLPNYSDKEFDTELAAVGKNFDRLKTGDPWLPLRVPETAEIQEQLNRLVYQWERDLRPLFEQAREKSQPVRLTRLSEYGEEISTFSNQIEQYRSSYLWQLRYLQILLIVLAIGSLFTIIALLLRWVIRPLDRLGEGINRLSGGDLAARVVVPQTEDEFCRITTGFNRMADRLEDLYNNLEQKVAEKTAVVEEKNRHLAQLYEMTAFFSRQRTFDEVTEGFVERIVGYTDADGAAITLCDTKRERGTVVASCGLPAELLKRLTTENIEGRLCERVLSKNYPLCVHLDREESGLSKLLTSSGYVSAYCFQIRSAMGDIGIYTLLFRKDPQLSSQTVQLLESISTHLGTAIENTRLIERDRQFAVIQERQLLAQGLHDSIAQALSFLNLQVQLLDEGIKQKDDELRDESLSAIRTGVQECYEDVRELLLNFRERLHKEGFIDGVKTVIDRFEGQSHVSVRLQTSGPGTELTERQKLQVIFIIQEALSNVRKHAQAEHVEVRVENDDDLTVEIIDDGIGIDERVVEARRGQHVGLSIMAERASRIGANVSVERASPIGGTRVKLVLPASARRPH